MLIRSSGVRALPLQQRFGEQGGHALIDAPARLPTGAALELADIGQQVHALHFPNAGFILSLIHI